MRKGEREGGREEVRGSRERVKKGEREGGSEGGRK